MANALNQTGTLCLIQLCQQLHRLVTSAAKIVGNFFDCVINEHAPVLVVPAVFLGQPHAVKQQAIQQLCFDGYVFESLVRNQQAGNTEVAELFRFVAIEII